jgi:outer membrane protein OmpA-like peptidoglycan-associated protein
MSLSLHTDEPSRREEPGPSGEARTLLVVVAGLLVLVLAGVGLLAWQLRQRSEALARQVAALSARADAADSRSQQALERAAAAEGEARSAEQGREAAEVETARARQETAAARQEAAGEREKASQAQAEAERVKQRAEAELNRMQQALGQIAETRRTALGLVMNLGGDHLKFAFDKAELRAQDRELLSRIAGILSTATDYTISVNGYTDDVGSDEYNQKLSERRAQAVHDYLVEVGLSRDILSVQGYGKSRPLVPGTSEEARAKNRRVELGIVNTRILYGRDTQQLQSPRQD